MSDKFPKFIAIFDEQLLDYKWYETKLPPYYQEERLPTPDGAVEIRYKKTGRYVTREDGEQAEILVQE